MPSVFLQIRTVYWRNIYMCMPECKCIQVVDKIWASFFLNGHLPNVNNRKQIMKWQWEQASEIAAGGWRGNKTFLYKQTLIKRIPAVKYTAEKLRAAAAAWQPLPGTQLQVLQQGPRNLILGKWGAVRLHKAQVSSGGM